MALLKRVFTISGHGIIFVVYGTNRVTHSLFLDVENIDKW